MATTSALSIYGDTSFDALDVGSIIRVGHPDIAEGDDHIVAAIERLRRRAGRGLTILDVGSGSGDLTVRLAAALADCRVVAVEPAPGPAAQARRKLSDAANAEVFQREFEQWSSPVDVVVSWGTHHHLRHDYLDHVARLLRSGGTLIIGDEFCPEYLTADDLARVDAAPQLTFLDGYLFVDGDDVARYRATARPPDWSVRLEQARRRALWTWYRFVIDFAVATNASGRRDRGARDRAARSHDRRRGRAQDVAEVAGA